MGIVVREKGDTTAILGTPIMLGTEIFATLSFSDGLTFSREETELLQMMARSLGRTIEQSRVTERLTFQARHDSLTALQIANTSLKCWRQR